MSHVLYTIHGSKLYDEDALSVMNKNYSFQLTKNSTVFSFGPQMHGTLHAHICTEYHF